MRTLQRSGPAIGRAGQATALGEASMRRRRFTLSLESGETRLLDVAPMEAPAAELPAGYHTLRAEDGEDARPVIVSPGRCHVPEDIAHGRRVFGLASHLYALRHAASEGIGDFVTLKRFGHLTAEIGGHYAGLNPLHHMFPSDRSG